VESKPRGHVDSRGAGWGQGQPRYPLGLPDEDAYEGALHAPADRIKLWHQTVHVSEGAFAIERRHLPELVEPVSYSEPNEVSDAASVRTFASYFDT
jgi:hypothetical protein